MPFKSSKQKRFLSWKKPKLYKKWKKKYGVRVQSKVGKSRRRRHY